MTNLTLSFTLRNETKGALRFEEKVSDSLAEPKIGTLYVRKSAIRDMGLSEAPRALTLTLSVETK